MKLRRLGEIKPRWAPWASLVLMQLPVGAFFILAGFQNSRYSVWIFDLSLAASLSLVVSIIYMTIMDQRRQTASIGKVTLVWVGTFVLALCVPLNIYLLGYLVFPFVYMIVGFSAIVIIGFGAMYFFAFSNRRHGA